MEAGATSGSKADCFLELLKPIEGDLETYGRRLVWQPEDAPDAIQNSVMRAFAAFDRYHESGQLRYRLAHGNYPESLPVLAPRFIESIPADVIGGRPLRYQLKPKDGYVLYSVG